MNGTKRPGKSKLFIGQIYGGDFCAERAPNLHGDVSQSSDAENRQALAAGNICLLECPKHGDACTEKGRCFNGGKTVWDFQSVARRRSCKFRVAAINGHSGDFLASAEILVPFAAEFAIAATPVEPWHTNTVADSQIARLRRLFQLHARQFRVPE